MSLDREGNDITRRRRVRNTFRRVFSVACIQSVTHSVRAGSQTMSHQGRNGQDGRPARQVAGRAGLMLVIAASLWGTAGWWRRHTGPTRWPR